MTTFTKDELLDHLLEKPYISKAFLKNPFLENLLSGIANPISHIYTHNGIVLQDTLTFIYNKEKHRFETEDTIEETFRYVQEDIEAISALNLKLLHQIPINLKHLQFIHITMPHTHRFQNPNTDRLIQFNFKYIQAFIRNPFGSENTSFRAHFKPDETMPFSRLYIDKNQTAKAFYLTKTKGQQRMIPMPLHLHLDTGLPVTYAPISLFDDFKPFQLISDLQNELVTLVPNRDDLFGSIRRQNNLIYNDVLPYTNKMDVILNKWRAASKLKKHINLNKLTIHEISLFLNLSRKLTPKEFNRVWNWFAANKSRIRNHIRATNSSRMSKDDLACRIYSSYILEHLKDTDADTEKLYFDILDMVKTWLKLRKSKQYKFKLEFPYTSTKRFYEFDQELIREYVRIVHKKENKITLYEQKKWTTLKDWVKTTKLKVKLLDKFEKLSVESTLQNNCVASYFDDARKGNCCLLHIDYDNKPHTVEIVIRNNHYKVVQNRTKYNQPEVDGCTKVIQDELDQLKIK